LPVATLSHEHGVSSGFQGTFSTDGSIFTVADLGWVDWFDASTGTLLASQRAGSEFSGVWTMPGRSQVITMSPQPAWRIQLELLDPGSSNAIATTQPSSTFGAKLEWSPDRKQLVVIGDNTHEILNPFTLRRLATIGNRGTRYSDHGFSSDGSLYASITGGALCQVEVFDTRDWKRLGVIEDPSHGMKGRFSDAMFIRDNKHLLTAADIGIARLWRLRRPMAAWGIVALPQFWLAAIFTLCFLISLARDAMRHDPDALIRARVFEAVPLSASEPGSR
jgi:hypothetical protein